MTTRAALYYTRIICIVAAIITLAAVLYYIFLPCITFYDPCLPPCIDCCNCNNHSNTDSSTVVPVESDHDDLENNEV